MASRKVGKTGKVIGIDMTEEMIAKARILTKEHGYSNVEFRLWDIEKMPIDDNSVDVIISNCLINLAPDKAKVFREAYCVLRSGGKMFVSDILCFSASLLSSNSMTRTYFLAALQALYKKIIIWKRYEKQASLLT